MSCVNIIVQWQIDYTSLLGREDRAKRFSEEVEDTDLKDSVRLQKVFREIQRQISRAEREKVDKAADF